MLFSRDGITHWLQSVDRYAGGRFRVPTEKPPNITTDACWIRLKLGTKKSDLLNFIYKYVCQWFLIKLFLYNLAKIN